MMSLQKAPLQLITSINFSIEDVFHCIYDVKQNFRPFQYAYNLLVSHRLYIILKDYVVIQRIPRTSKSTKTSYDSCVFTME